MPTSIVVPQLGNEIDEAEVTEWLVGKGDTVSEGDLVVVITTTKMAMEVEAPASGTLAKMSAVEGELVSVGASLGEIE